jgi:ABC-type antimicrobial peptide transport system permease subunit
LIGLGLGWLLLKGSEAGDFPLPGLKWQSALLVLTMAAIIGLLAATVPALIASRKNVVESIRFTG